MNIVKRNRLDLPNSGLSINLDTPEWFEWLESGINSFQYIYSRDRTFRATKRGGNKYWYAKKTIWNQQRTLYIGKTEKLTASKLYEVCMAINMHDAAWRRNEKSKKSNH